MTISVRITFPLILAVVMMAHALLFGVKAFNHFSSFQQPQTRRLTVQRIENGPKMRTVGAHISKLKGQSVVIIPKGSAQDALAKKPISLKDLTPAPSKKPVVEKKMAQMTEPRQRPGQAPSTQKAIKSIHLSGAEIQKIAANGANLGGLGHIEGLDANGLSMNIEIPEGVHPDELNEYELKYYSFMRRGAIQYLNSVYKELDKFNRQNPHLKFPMTDSLQTLTGRLTYDEKGNLKQIKMVRWTNVAKLQAFFEAVLKDLDTLQNPPQQLWEKEGEFSVFVTLQIND